MIDPIPLPESRIQNMLDWPKPFLKGREPFEFFVQIHEVNFCFHLENFSLYKQLKDFFPSNWQVKSTERVDVYWRRPMANSEALKRSWDLIPDPDCQFFGDYISQRDFLAKKVSATHYEVFAFEEIGDGLFNFLRALLPQHVLELNKVLFHSSCAVTPGGEAVIFFGPSGAGKTTISQLCKDSGARILGDDMNLLVIEGDQVFVEAAAVGQRIYNKENFGQRFPVKQFFWLKKSKSNNSRNITFGGQAQLLSSFANLFWNQISPQQYNKIFHILSIIYKNNSLKELEFQKNRQVWEYVQSNL